VLYKKTTNEPGKMKKAQEDDLSLQRLGRKVLRN